MSTEQKSGLVGAYDKRDFEAGPSVYSDEELLQKIRFATGLEMSEDSKRVVDLMSGPGKVGLALRENIPNHQYLFIDIAGNQLAKIPEAANILKFQSDARRIPIASESVDIVVARYAIKDLTATEQPLTLKEVRRILKKSSSFVLVDMIAPSQLAKDWLNKQHSLKQELGGRNPSLEGKCYIPTESGWINLLDRFNQVRVFSYHVSKVDTQSWVSGKQIIQSDICKLNHMILTAPSEVIAQFKIQSTSHPHWVGNSNITLREVIEVGERLKVTIEYPTIIIQAFREN